MIKVSKEEGKILVDMLTEKGFVLTAEYLLSMQSAMDEAERNEHHWQAEFDKAQKRVLELESRLVAMSPSCKTCSDSSGVDCDGCGPDFRNHKAK